MRAYIEAANITKEEAIEILRLTIFSYAMREDLTNTELCVVKAIKMGLEALIGGEE